MTLGDLQQALRQWLILGAPLSGAKVYFADQKAPRQEHEFATIRIEGLTRLGAFDEHQDIYDAGRPNGQEIEQRVKGQREVRVTAQFFTRKTVSIPGSPSAMELALNAQAALVLPDVALALAAGGLTMFDQGNVTNLSRVLDDDWEGRAELAVRFYTQVRVSSFVGYFATAELNGTIDEA